MGMELSHAAAQKTQNAIAGMSFRADWRAHAKITMHLGLIVLARFVFVRTEPSERDKQDNLAREWVVRYIKLA
jgi:hypothetical protein